MYATGRLYRLTEDLYGFGLQPWLQKPKPLQNHCGLSVTNDLNTIPKRRDWPG